MREVEKRIRVEASSYAIDSETGVDGLPPGEGAFLACSFWLADSYSCRQGRQEEANVMLDRLLAVRNDLGSAQRGI